MKSIYTTLLILLIAGTGMANPPDYETRRLAYIDNAITNFNGDAITIQAYKGIPVDQPELTRLMDNLRTHMDADFDIVKLIRVLELSHGEYDSQILPVLDSIPFWLTKNEKLRVYWSENHMIMWMSSDWLLHEKYGRTIDSNLDSRLRHYLHLKIQYGFYEFFSTVYNPYCLSGLLNLADFAQDAEIKALATQAAQKLMKQLLVVTNDKGVIFAAAGRNYYGKYGTPYGQNHNNLIYLLTGMGPMPNGSHAGDFLATSTIPVDDVMTSWQPNLDTLYHVGHSLQDGVNNINVGISQEDKVIFQWSSGAYFHPDVALSTATLISDLNLWDHSEFSDFSAFRALPISLAPTIADIASPISKSSTICGQDIAIFKNKSITLTSIQDFWKGKVGYQEFPVVANVGTTPVFTASGKEYANWEDHPELHANEDLPYVAQKKNVALIMYRPEKTLPIFGHKDFDVALYWKDADFDEIREDGPWLLGRQGNSYVAVRRHCTGYINGVRACAQPDGQTWVIMVGNSDLHGSFDNFQSIVEQNQYEEKWYFDLPTLHWVYYAKIVVDGKTIEYAWDGDIISGPTVTGIKDYRNGSELSLYPNPARDNVTLDLSAFTNKTTTIRVMNIIGQEVYNEELKNHTSMETINTSNWQEGVYIVTAENEDMKFTQKLLIKR